MKTEYRGIIAIAISAAFFMIWFTYINPPAKNLNTAQNPPSEVSKQEKPADASAGVLEKPSVTKVTTSGAADPQANITVKTWTIKNRLVEMDITSDGAVPTSIKILDYHKGTEKTSPVINLASEALDFVPPLSISFEKANFEFPERPRFEIVSADETKVVFKWRSADIEIKKEISLKENSYLADVGVEIKNLSKNALACKPVLTFSGVMYPEKDRGLLGFLKQPSVDNKIPVFYLDGKVHRESNIAKIAEKSEIQGALLWSGLESRYFLGVVIPRVQGDGMGVSFGQTKVIDAPEGTMGLWVGAALPAVSIPAGDVTKSDFSVYLGPKEMTQLKSVGVHLDEAMDYGWFTVVAIPILYLLKFFYGLINNYGIAIILLTIFVKLLLHPINVKSLKSMKAMQQLQPRLKELQKKFANDKQKLNQETMQLFRAHKVNPMGGCLPMLLQFPIYIALYKVLWNSIELYHAPFFWFYRDLSAPDPYLITPILLGIFMVAQQKLMPSTSADPAQQKMMMMMPVMFSVFMLFLPVGLVVYILVNTVMSVTQQYMYNHGIGLMDLVKGRLKKTTS